VLPAALFVFFLNKLNEIKQLHFPLVSLLKKERQSNLLLLLFINKEMPKGTEMEECELRNGMGPRERSLRLITNQ